mgnify:CR=1 FL=1
MARVCATQRFAVLATCADGQPYASLVAFAAGDSLAQLAFATLRATRKYANLRANPRAALLLDSRAHQPDDLSSAEAITAAGRAREVQDAERTAWAVRYAARHPGLRAFVSRPECALFVLDVDQYHLARQFGPSVAPPAP